MPVALVVCLWGVALTDYKEIFYISTGIIEGILVVAISDYINRLIPSETRATVLSFQSMVFSFFMIIAFPLVGWIGDRYSLSNAFAVMAAVGTVILILFIFFRQNEKNMKNEV